MAGKGVLVLVSGLLSQVLCQDIFWLTGDFVTLSLFI